MNKRNFMFLALLGAMVLNGHGEVRAQDASRFWHNVDVNQQNPLSLAVLRSLLSRIRIRLRLSKRKNSANDLSMEGTWKFRLGEGLQQASCQFLRCQL